MRVMLLKLKLQRLFSVSLLINLPSIVFDFRLLLLFLNPIVLSLIYAKITTTNKLHTPPLSMGNNFTSARNVLLLLLVRVTLYRNCNFKLFLCPLLLKAKIQLLIVLEKELALKLFLIRGKRRSLIF